MIEYLKNKLRAFIIQTVDEHQRSKLGTSESFMKIWRQDFEADDSSVFCRQTAWNGSQCFSGSSFEIESANQDGRDVPKQ